MSNNMTPAAHRILRSRKNGLKIVIAPNVVNTVVPLYAIGESNKHIFGENLTSASREHTSNEPDMTIGSPVEAAARGELDDDEIDALASNVKPAEPETQQQPVKRRRRSAQTEIASNIEAGEDVL